MTFVKAYLLALAVMLASAMALGGWLAVVYITFCLIIGAAS